MASSMRRGHWTAAIAALALTAGCGSVSQPVPKQEAPADWLERRRRQYLALTEIVPNFVVVNVDRPVAEVTREVADIIRKFLETGNT